MFCLDKERGNQGVKKKKGRDVRKPRTGRKINVDFRRDFSFWGGKKKKELKLNIT